MWARLRYVNLDLRRPGAPAGEESRKAGAGDDMMSMAHVRRGETR